jgi:hypothetical protein
MTRSMSKGQGASAGNGAGGASFSNHNQPPWWCEADRLAGWENIPVAHWGLYN